MSPKVTEKLNKTQGQDVLIACSKCAGKTAHKVVISLDQTGEDVESDVHWSHHFQVIQCQGCKALSFRDASTNSHDYFRVAEDEWEHTVYEKIYPSRVEGRRDIGNDARYLPMETQRVYEETLQALNNNSPVLAGIGLRALLETVCKERNATGRNLLDQIDNLATQNILTPASAKILHKIRTLGNAAAHEVKPHTESQLSLGMSIVEHLLRDVYILPRLADAEFPP